MRPSLRRPGRRAPWLALLLLGCSSATPRDLSRPSHTRVGADGALLIADFQHHRVVRAGAQGPRFVGRRGLGEGALWRVRGLDTTEDGGFVVVNFRLETLSDQNSAVRELKRFDAEGRETLSFPILEPGQTELGWPSGVAVTPEGYVISDSDRERLLFFDVEGHFQRALPVEGGELRAPRYRDGRLWIAEPAAHRVRALSLEGEELLRIGQEGEGPGELRFPWSVDASAEQIVVADLGNYRVQRFDRSGAPLGSFEPEPAGPRQPPQLLDVTLAEDGSVWVTDSKGDRVMRVQGEAVLETLHAW